MPEPTEGEAAVAEDTSVSEAVDTSTNDDSADLEDIEVDLDAFDDEESSDDDEDEPASEPEPEEQSKEDVAEESTEDESVEEDTTSDEKSQSEIAREAYKRREAERQLREERQAREKADLDRYLEEAGDDEVELERRQLQVEKHLLSKEKATVLQEKLSNGIDKAVANIDLFKKGSPEIQEELAKSLDDFERMYVVKDKQGTIQEVKADVYQYLTDKADSYRKLAGIGAREQTKQKLNEKTRTVTRPTRAPKEPTQDKDLNDFDEGWN
jgi:hypothetical protein